MKNINFIFLGTDDFSIYVLDKLMESDYIPNLIITAPDRKAGRGQKIQKSPVKIWAESNNIKVLSPEKIDELFIGQIKNLGEWDLSIVASYGKILPLDFLNIPKFQTINVHPSLLPKYRGASPIESAILEDDKETGVSIMLMDAKMDHGPIFKQEVIGFEEWNSKTEIEKTLAQKGAESLVEIIPKWVDRSIEPKEQNHEIATFTKKVVKEDGLISFIDLQDEKKAREIYLKIIAYKPWPSVYFDINHLGESLRVKITGAVWENGNLKITKVIPADRKEMDYESFKMGFIK